MQSTLTRVGNQGLALRRTTRHEHDRFVRRESARTRAGHISFMQCPSWADVKSGWQARFVGWFDGGRQVGGALVLCRKVPHTAKFFAYIPEGPILDWTRPDVAQQITMLGHDLLDAGAFAVRIGLPLEHRRWNASTLKQAVGPGRRVADVRADELEPLAMDVAALLTRAGWSRCDDATRGGAQPRYLVTVPLGGPDRDPWESLSQSWRRNIRRARRADVSVAGGGPEDIPAFHELVHETEQRQGFNLGRTRAYFDTQFRVLNADAPDRIRLYLASQGGTLLAAHTLVTLGRRAWYLTGGSAAQRDVGSGHLLQWQMIQDATARDVTTYDMRGVPTTLDPADPEFGLVRWKLGTGGHLVETLGEWEIGLPGLANRALHYGFRRYLANRHG